LPIVNDNDHYLDSNHGEISSGVLQICPKYVVDRWYSREKLNQLIKDLNSGKSFDASFNK